MPLVQNIGEKPTKLDCHLLKQFIVEVSILFVTRSGLVEENAVELFHHYGFHLCSSLLIFSGKIMWYYSMSFPHLHAVGQLVVHLTSSSPS